MSWYSYELDKLVKEMKFVPYKLRKGARYEVGKTYWCGYWNDAYEVLSVNGSKVKIRWLSSGKEVEHMTSLDYRYDYELRPFEYKVEWGWDNYSFTGAELKALCCAQKLDPITINVLRRKFEDDKYAPNQNVYYFIEIKRVNEIGERRTYLTRDLKKSPRRNKKEEK